MTAVECSTRYSERIHLRAPEDSPLTLCNYLAVALKTDRKHREDSFCRRCLKAAGRLA